MSKIKEGAKPVEGFITEDVTTLTKAQKIEWIHKRIEDDTSVIMAFFKEVNTPGNAFGHRPIFNFSNEDFGGTLSLYKLYKDYVYDETDIRFIDEVLGGNFHLWERMKRHGVMNPYFMSLFKEMEARRLAYKMEAIADIAKDVDNKARFSALKYLCDTNVKNAEAAPKRGRPSKEELQAAKEKALKEDAELSSVLVRLRTSAAS